MKEDKKNWKTLAELLAGHEGEKFYCTLYGEVELVSINTRQSCGYPITVSDKFGRRHSFCKDGKYDLLDECSECVLFPSKENRDWNVWGGGNDMDPVGCGNWKSLTFDELLDRKGNGTQFGRRLARARAKFLIDEWYGGSDGCKDDEGYSLRLEGGEVVISAFPVPADPLRFRDLRMASLFISRAENISLAREALGWQAKQNE